MTHASAVYTHHFGPVPEGYHIHHKNGQHTTIEDDRPENLIAVPAIWNARVFPTLAMGFNVPEAVVTTAYMKVIERVPEEHVFRALCEELSWVA